MGIKWPLSSSHISATVNYRWIGWAAVSAHTARQRALSLTLSSIKESKRRVRTGHNLIGLELYEYHPRGLSIATNR